MKEKLTFVELLFKDLLKNFKIYVENREKANKTGNYCWENYNQTNYGKTALKRKITLIRQELLNLERMLDE